MHGVIAVREKTNPVPLADDDLPWHAAIVQPQFDRLVVEGLTIWGCKGYSPQEPKRVRHKWPRTGFTWVKRPMMPGYVFVSFDSAGERWKYLTNIPGLLRVIQYDERPIPIPTEAMARMWNKEAELGAGKFPKNADPLPCKQNDWVQIIDHASFSGLMGKVRELFDTKGRCIVELDLFGRLTPVEVSGNQVRVL